MRPLTTIIGVLNYISRGRNTMACSNLPHFANGVVIKGFGRGSKELGIPTANYGPEVVDNLPKGIETGVYYGFANVANSTVHKMVMSIGWNPYYHNEKKSMETHIMHQYENDFYGQELKVCILGYLRPEMNFNSLDELICAIKKDISDADKYLDEGKNSTFKTHEFFRQ